MLLDESQIHTRRCDVFYAFASAWALSGIISQQGQIVPFGPDLSTSCLRLYGEFANLSRFFTRPTGTASEWGMASKVCTTGCLEHMQICQGGLFAEQCKRYVNTRKVYPAFCVCPHPYLSRCEAENGIFTHLLLLFACQLELRNCVLSSIVIIFRI